MRRLLAALLLLAVSVTPVIGLSDLLVVPDSHYAFGKNVWVLARSSDPAATLHLVCTHAGVTLKDETHLVRQYLFRLQWPGSRAADCIVSLPSGVNDTFTVS